MVEHNLAKVGVAGSSPVFRSMTLSAQMAESVDALVSNTSEATHPGSIPGLGTGSRNRNAEVVKLVDTLL